MDTTNNVWLRQQQQVVVTLKIERMIGEALTGMGTVIVMRNHTTVVVFSQLVLLNHRPHCAIQDKDALF